LLKSLHITGLEMLLAAGLPAAEPTSESKQAESALWLSLWHAEANPRAPLSATFDAGGRKSRTSQNQTLEEQRDSFREILHTTRIVPDMVARGCEGIACFRRVVYVFTALARIYG
jgi:hypothetical protein